MVIIGITGNPGSGKSTISEMLFKDYNTEVVHLDSLFDNIKKNMPSDMVTTTVRDDGYENIFLTHNKFYKTLRSNPILSKVYSKLRIVVAKSILGKTINEAHHGDIDFLLIEGVSLLDYFDADDLDFIILVTAQDEVRKNRIERRNTKVELEANNPFYTYVSSEVHDIEIDNSGSFDELNKKIGVVEEIFLSNRYIRELR